MPYKTLRAFLVVILMMCVPLAFAESGGGGESGEGEASAKAKEKERKIPEEEDWAKQVTVLNTKEGKVKGYVKEISELIKKKQSSKSKEEKRALIDQMMKAHVSLREEVDGYNVMRTKLKYRFPNKGELSERRYMPMKVQSLEKMEKEIGIDAKLTMIRKKINDKYKPFITRELHYQQKKTGENFDEKRAPASEKRVVIEF